MGNEEHDAGSDLAERDVPLLFIVDLIPAAQGIRIFEDNLSGLEIDVMFREIPPVPPLVVFESHAGLRFFLYSRVCTYKCQYPSFRVTRGIWKRAAVLRLLRLDLS